MPVEYAHSTTLIPCEPSLTIRSERTDGGQDRAAENSAKLDAALGASHRSGTGGPRRQPLRGLKSPIRFS